MSAWEEELGDDYDRDFLLRGIANGFDIIDPDAKVTALELNNHASALKESNKVLTQIKEEVSLGNYQVTDTRPTIVSPLGAVPKPDGSIRLIHDCSLPAGFAVNDYAIQDEKQKFQTIDSATKILTPGCFMAKIDLKSAYRSVQISPASQKVTGLKWTVGGKTVYFYDKKLCFGASRAPAIFHRLSQAVRRMMSRKGIHGIVAYIDDFLIVTSTFEECKEAFLILVQLLRKLGFMISWKKVIDPCQRIIFLGVEIDSLCLCVRLPDAKLQAFRRELQAFRQLKRATKRQLQHLCGRLNWAAAVVRGGRVYLRNIINAINRLKHQRSRVRLGADVQGDIAWWNEFMPTFNGVSAILDKQPITCLCTDACTQGAGAVFMYDWVYVNFARDWPEVLGLHINFLEILAIVIACYRWCASWRNKRIIVLSDNQTAVSRINKGSCKDPLVMPWLRGLFWLSAKYNFHLSACFLKGHKNVVADSISRLHEPGQLATLTNMLPRDMLYPLWGHMSASSCDSICRCQWAAHRPFEPP